MFNIFSQLAFGLELSDLSLKIVQFKKTGKKIFLNSFTKEKIPAGLIEGGEIRKEKELVAALKKSLSKTKGGSLKTKQVVCNLPEEKVFIRIIQLPHMRREEISEAIKWEIEAHIPLSLDEVYLDWQIIKPVFNQADHIDVLIAAAPRKLIDSYLSFLKKSGLQPIAFEPESIAMVRSLIKPDNLKPTIIVDLGTTGANFVIFSASSVRFTSRVSAVSGRIFDQAIAKSLGVTEKEASWFKVKIGFDKAKEGGKIYQALEPAIDELVKQIKDYIDFYHEHATHIHGPDGMIGQVVLCGGDSLLKNLIPYLNQELKLPVKLGNPLANISDKFDSSKGVALSKEGFLSSVVATGLALREIDFKNDD